MPREQVHHFCYTPVDTCRKARQSVTKLTHIDNARVLSTTEARALALKWNPEVDLVALGLDRRRGRSADSRPGPGSRDRLHEDVPAVPRRGRSRSTHGERRPEDRRERRARSPSAQGPRRSERAAPEAVAGLDQELDALIRAESQEEPNEKKAVAEAKRRLGGLGELGGKDDTAHVLARKALAHSGRRHRTRSRSRSRRRRRRRSSSRESEEEPRSDKHQNVFQRVARKEPGKLLMRALRGFREQLGQSYDDQAQDQFSPVCLRFLLSIFTPAYPVKKMGDVRYRELRTLAESIDLLIQGNTLAALDMLVQRLKASMVAVKEDSWSSARFMELLPAESGPSVL
eukprot:1404709-Amphidinium_carterae.1